MNFRILLALLLILNIVSVKAQTLSDEMQAIADITVAFDGSADYTSVQAAINAIPDFNDTWTIIYVMNGTYYEKVILGYKKTKVVLVGEDVDSTIITYDDYGNKVLPGHTFSTYTFRADAHDFQAYNISFECTAGGRGQGVAYHANGDRQALYHCRLLGEQDTYFDNFRTRKYFKDCYVEGTTDYLFGFGVSLFDSCQIHSLSGSYITASSTPEHYEFGHVIKNSRLTERPSVTGVTLGRPWFDYANTMFYECWEPESIKPAGWGGWSDREETCIYQEYNCFGPGSDTTERVDFGKQLNPALADRYNIDTIFAKSNFPSDLGYTVDTAEFMLMYRRFEASGYAERADTILYAGRDTFPEYPTENWSPEFYTAVHDIVSSYTIPFMDSANGILDVESVLLNGVELPDFHPDSLSYAIELDDTVTIMPKLTLIGNGTGVSESYPESLPGEAKISTLSYDRVNGREYKVYFSQDSVYWDADLVAVVINGDSVDLVRGVYSYDVSLPPGDTKIRNWDITNTVKDQKWNKSYPSSYPGVATIKVTAPSKIAQNLYEFNISLTPDKVQDIITPENFYLVNPASGIIQFSYMPDPVSEGEFILYDQMGKTLLVSKLEPSSAAKVKQSMDVSQYKSGIYYYQLRIGGENFSGSVLLNN